MDSYFLSGILEKAPQVWQFRFYFLNVTDHDNRTVFEPLMDMDITVEVSLGVGWIKTLYSPQDFGISHAALYHIVSQFEGTPSSWGHYV